MPRTSPVAVRKKSVCEKDLHVVIYSLTGWSRRPGRDDKTLLLTSKVVESLYRQSFYFSQRVVFVSKVKGVWKAAHFLSRPTNKKSVKMRNNSSPSSSPSSPSSSQSPPPARGLYCGKPFFGIPVTIHWSYPLLYILQLVLLQQWNPAANDGDDDDIASKSGSKYYLLSASLLYGPILLCSVLIHEYGHALMNTCLGGNRNVQHIVVWPLGGSVVLDKTAGNTVWEDFAVTLAGPLTHLPQAAFWMAVYYMIAKATGEEGLLFGNMLSDAGAVTLSDPAVFVLTLIQRAVFLNLALFVVNVCIPAYPLDGGSLLAALLVSCGVEIDRAGVITACTAFLWAAVLGLFGIIELCSGGTAMANESGGHPLVAVQLIVFAVWLAACAIPLWRDARDYHALSHPLFHHACYRKHAAESQKRRQDEKDRDEEKSSRKPTSTPNSKKKRHALDDDELSCTSITSESYSSESVSADHPIVEVPSECTIIVENTGCDKTTKPITEV